MKKLLICLLFILSGCTSEKTTVCKVKEEGLSIVNTIVSEENRVIKQTLMNEIQYDLMGYDEKDIESFTELYSRAYDIEGVEYTYEVKEGNLLIETIVVNYKKVDLNSLKTLGLVENLDNMKYISLDRTISSLEDLGYKCE